MWWERKVKEPNKYMQDMKDIWTLVKKLTAYFELLGDLLDTKSNSNVIWIVPNNPIDRRYVYDKIEMPYDGARAAVIISNAAEVVQIISSFDGFIDFFGKQINTLQELLSKIKVIQQSGNYQLPRTEVQEIEAIKITCGGDVK